MTVHLLITILATAGLPQGPPALPRAGAPAVARDSLGSFGGELLSGFS